MSLFTNTVATDCFRTLRTPLVRGRGFEPGDCVGTTPVAILNETAAERLWPGTDPIGRRFGVTALGGTALVASWLPARRATRVDPVAALRAE